MDAPVFSEQKIGSVAKFQNFLVHLVLHLYETASDRRLRGHDTGYEDRRYSNRYSTPQGPRESHPLPGSPPRPNVSPGGTRS